MTVASHTHIPELPRYQFTRDQYYQLAELGYFNDRRVELIEGEIFTMSPQKNAHFLTLNLAAKALAKIFGEDYWVRSQGPLNLGQASDPEPDVAVVKGAMGSFSDHPTNAVLIVEVSDSTLRLDRLTKASLYARAGIADYWIINLKDRQLEVLRNPAPDADAPFGFSYTNIKQLTPDDNVASLAIPSATISVADLLP